MRRSKTDKVRSFTALIIILLFIISTWNFAAKNYHLLHESNHNLLEFEKLVIVLGLQYSILVVLLATVFININRRNRAHSSEIEDELLVMNSAISLAFKSSTKVIFSYDFNNHTARYVFGNMKLWGLPLFVKNYPEILFEQDIVLAQDRQNLFDALKRAETSTDPVTCIVKHIFEDSSVGWNRVTLTSVHDIEDSAIFSVGFLEDVTAFITAEKHAAQEKYARRALLSETAKVMRINLLNDTATFLDDEGNAEDTELKYSGYIEENARIVDPNIRKEFIDMFSPVSIVALSNSGTNTISYDFLNCPPYNPTSAPPDKTVMHLKDGCGLPCMSWWRSRPKTFTHSRIFMT